MFLSPKVEGNRPRLACEIAAGGVVAARSNEPGGPVTAVARVELAEGAIVPSLHPGNVADRVATIAAVRRALEGVGARSNARNADITLVIPDGAVRVLLLDFDTLPGKITEALPIVRFRLKKLVPFDTDEAMVSYQSMSSTRGTVRVLAVAIPRDVLADYETVVREAGFEPGAVLPSTLAAVAALPESEPGVLAVNVYPSAVTTAIVRGGVLLLHRTVELTEHGAGTPAALPAALFEPSPASQTGFPDTVAELLPLVSVEDTAEEWAAQEPEPAFGRNPYADAAAAEAVVEDSYGMAGVGTELQELKALGEAEETAGTVHTLAPEARSEEIARAVSVAVAYFEDLLSMPPDGLLSAGPMGAEALDRTLREQGLLQELGLRSRELVEGAALTAEAATGSVPRSLLAGVTGALRS